MACSSGNLRGNFSLGGWRDLGLGGGAEDLGGSPHHQVEPVELREEEDANGDLAAGGKCLDCLLIKYPNNINYYVMAKK